MCRVLKVNRSGFYAWKKNPLSKRAKENAQILTDIKQSYVESGGIYGSPRIHKDLKEAGVACSENRVAKIMRNAQLKSARGYRKPRFKAGKPTIAAPVRRKIYATREEARSDIFDYIEVFYNRKRRHSHLNQMSPLAFEQQQFGS
jgi:transposase InsO family protein